MKAILERWWFGLFAIAFGVLSIAFTAAMPANYQEQENSYLAAFDQQFDL